MKKILIILFALVIGRSGMAQLSIEDTAYAANGTLDGLEYVFYTHVINTGKSNLTPKWRRIKDEHPGGWFSQICIGDLCYAAEVSSGNFIEVLYGGDTSEISVHITDDGTTPGEALVELVIFDPADSLGNHVKASFSYGAYPTGIAKGQSAPVLLAPNPAGDVIYLRFTEKESGFRMAGIYDLSGRKVLSFTLGDEARSALDISSVDPAAYILIVRDAGGKVLLNRQFIKE